MSKEYNKLVGRIFNARNFDDLIYEAECLVKQNKQLKNTLSSIMASDGETTTPVLNLVNENKQLKEKIKEAIDLINQINGRKVCSEFNPYLDKILEILESSSDSND